MALELIIGPAHAGKIAALYERYLAELAGGRPAVLVVPDRATSAATEAELLARSSGVLGADVMTFDTLFARILADAGDERTLIAEPARQLLLHRLLPSAPESLATRFDRLGSALLDPAGVRAAGDAALADDYAAWWSLLDAHGLLDRGRLRITAIEALRGDVRAWRAGEALFAQGFDDLSPAQEALLATVAQRARVVASLPYEAGRSVFAALAPSVSRLADLAGPAGITDLPAGTFDRAAGLACVERRLGEPDPDTCAPPPNGTDIAIAEVEGERGEAEVVVQEVAAALRSGIDGERIGVIAPSGSRGRARLLRQLREAGIAVAGEAPEPVLATPFGRALLALLQLSWAPEPSAEDRLTWLRSPWSGAPQHLVDRCERPLRRSLDSFDGAVEKAGEPILRALAPPAGARGGATAVLEATAAVRGMLRQAHGDQAPVPDADLRADLERASTVLSALDGLVDVEPAASRAEVLALLSTLSTYDRPRDSGAVRVCDPRGARTVDLDVVIVLGLEEPMFGAGGDAARDPLVAAPDPADVARQLAYVAATRPRRRLVLVRRIANDDGSPLAATAIWEDLRLACGSPETTHQRRFSDAVLPLESAPTVRDRARALAHLAATDQTEALRLAGSVGVSGALRRAIAARRRGTQLTDQRVLEALRQRETFGVTDLDRFGDCSQIWFVEKRLGPSMIDQPIDNRLRVGTLAHTILGRFYKEVPALLGTTALGSEHADRSVVEMHRLVDEEVGRIRPLAPGDRLLLELLGWGLRRDLGRLVRRAARSEAPLVPSEFEVAFGGRSAQQGRKDGVDVGVARISGKIDRIDADPAFTARAMVVDYKTSTISSGAEIQRDGKLQIPIYLLALREVLGREPVGGVLVSIRKGHVRGILDEDELDVLPPDASREDRLTHEEFEAVLEAARAEAAHRVERIRAGDVRHDPRNATVCDRFCEYGGICRVAR